MAISFDRPVMFAGKVYGHHEVTGVQMYGGPVTVRVNSTDGSDTISGLFDVQDEDFAEGVFEQACSKVMALSAFEEYHDEAQEALDEVLPLLTDEQAEQVIDVFPLWKAGTAYTVGYRVRYNSLLYKCLQAHTSQADYAPDVAVSLWARIGEPGEIPVWEQPGSTNPYMKGDKVHYPTISDPIWVSTMDYNVYEPGIAGWELYEGGE